MIRRHLAEPLQAALARSPVVLLNGARQTGKTTLVQWLGREHPRRYVTLDDANTLAAARADPGGFIGRLDSPVVLDEVQRAPELFPAIKLAVDRNRQPGRFLLTGSANVLLLPRLSESLAGRMQILTLRPLSQGEIEGLREGFLDAVFGDAPLRPSGEGEARPGLLARVLRGGYPEIVGWPDEADRRAWFGSYVTTILQRDVREISNIEGLTTMPRLLALLAARSASLLSFAELSRSAAIPQSTLKRYMALLETTFLVDTVPAWSTNLSKRLLKASRLVLADTGLLGHVARVTEERLHHDPGLAGSLLESFVMLELKKQSVWSRTGPELFHFRTVTGQEVDIVLEDRGGRVVGIEVKASATIGAQDFKGLRALEEVARKRFHRGILLYSGSETLPFGPRFLALPIDALWRLGAQKIRTP